MSNKDYLLGEKSSFGLDNLYSHLGAQMIAPFYALSSLFLTAVNLQTDVGKLMNKESGSKDQRIMFTLETSKISPKVYSILEQKAKENELEDYITKLVEQDVEKLDKEEETITVLDTLRKEFLGKINLLKQEFASRVVVDPNEIGSGQAYELRNFVTKLGEQKLDKEEFQTLLNSLRSDLLDEISLLKNELAFRPDVPSNPNKQNPPVEPAEVVTDIKEGQLLESDRVKGTIEEVIDMDF
jgi:arsenate reductase-like glutaredoxin family protein